MDSIQYVDDLSNMLIESDVGSYIDRVGLWVNHVFYAVDLVSYGTLCKNVSIYIIIIIVC